MKAFLSEELISYLSELQNGLETIMDGKILGIYVHGSLALGGFNPKRSDVDLVVVVRDILSSRMKKELAHCFLKISKQPYPLEISILAAQQLTPWQFPTPYEFHFSEYWRDRYELELAEGTERYLNLAEKTDPDLAAHLTIVRHCGIRLSGQEVERVIPEVPKKDYLASLLGDYEACLQHILEGPVYCILNLIRVYWYLKEGRIASKKEAGAWGAEVLPEVYHALIYQAVHLYESGQTDGKFDGKDLNEFKDILKERIEELLNSKEHLSD